MITCHTWVDPMVCVIQEDTPFTLDRMVSLATRRSLRINPRLILISSKRWIKWETRVTDQNWCLGSDTVWTSKSSRKKRVAALYLKTNGLSQEKTKKSAKTVSERSSNCQSSLMRDTNFSILVLSLIKVRWPWKTCLMMPFQLILTQRSPPEERQLLGH